MQLRSVAVNGGSFVRDAAGLWWSNRSNGRYAGK